MAQGSVEYKWRFCTFDIAVRLLELSQTSKSEALQITCGMALSHLFTLVITSSSNGVPSTATSRGENTASSTSSASKLSKANSSNNAAAPFADTNASTLSHNPFLQCNVPGAGAKFVARVLEKGGLPVIVDTLRDGPPKLQQAYLNIINIVFSSVAATTEDVPHGGEAYTSSSTATVSTARALHRLRESID